MRSTLIRPILGVLVAIVITTTLDATGLSAFSALPLFPLICMFWYLERRSRRSMGFVWGRWPHYGLAVLYPVLVLGAITLISSAAGEIDLSQTNWNKAGLNLVVLAISTILIAIITEEGFFRGWLWARWNGRARCRAGSCCGRVSRSHCGTCRRWCSIRSLICQWPRSRCSS